MVPFFYFFFLTSIQVIVTLWSVIKPLSVDEKIVLAIVTKSEILGLTDEEMIQRLRDQEGYTKKEVKLFKKRKKFLELRNFFTKNTSNANTDSEAKEFFKNQYKDLKKEEKDQR